MENAEVPFRVLNSFRRGVILVSVPDGLVLRLAPGDVIHVTHYPKEAVTDTRFGAGLVEREAAARDIPAEGPADDADWRHDMNERRTDYRHV